MKRMLTSVAVAVVGCAVVVAGAGVASAHDHDRHEGRGAHFVEYRRYQHEEHGARAHGVAAGSPGVLSGNVIQIPINMPINVCGNSVGLLALLNPAFGNVCVNR